MELEIRRGFTTFQLMTILEEAHHSLIIVEHDPMLYEDAQEMTECISKALEQASYEATVLLYSPEIDPFLEDLTDLADRVFYFKKGQDSPKLTGQDMAGDEGSEDAGSFYMIYSIQLRDTIDEVTCKCDPHDIWHEC
jgi:hypothetical protein